MMPDSQLGNYNQTVGGLVIKFNTKEYGLRCAYYCDLECGNSDHSRFNKANCVRRTCDTVQVLIYFGLIGKCRCKVDGVTEQL